MLNKRRIALIMAILVLSVAVAGCAPKDEAPVETPSETPAESKELTVVDDFGRTVTLDSAPQRIISLAPSNTEILYAIGLGDKVVGVTTFDDYPAEVLEVEKIGDYNGINLERIIELEPDLVINYGQGNEEENTRLDEAGIKYVGFIPETIDSVMETIIRIGAITGADAEAEELVNELTARKEDIISKIADAEPKTVFYEIWHEPLMAAGPGSFFHELITMANGENIAADADSAYPQYDMEQLVERNPQVYLTSRDMPEKTEESIMARPGFESIDAIINKQVYVLDGNIMSRPGPRIIEALELVARAIHPEKF